MSKPLKIPVGNKYHKFNLYIPVGHLVNLGWDENTELEVKSYPNCRVLQFKEVMGESK